ncbi:MAG: ACT domain-containing protein [Verrucomicrobiae bacterium]|nr:ACT domain-containing protein [Verrucomicrobiae bacterium]
MQKNLVLTVIGPDRPGLVESLSRLVGEHGGNWTQSRMAHLAGQFAGILQIALPAEAVPGLRAALEASGELRVLIAEDEGDSVARETGRGLALKLDLVGQDRPGIVREISRILTAHGVNVEKLSTGCESAPWSGETLFRARATLQAPPDADIDALRTAIEAIAQDLMVDVTLARRV